MLRGFNSKDSASPGGGQGNPLQYSYVENPMDRGAWRATVHRVAQSRTRWKRLSTHSMQLSQVLFPKLICRRTSPWSLAPFLPLLNFTVKRCTSHPPGIAGVAWGVESASSWNEGMPSVWGAPLNHGAVNLRPPAFPCLCPIL